MNEQTAEATQPETLPETSFQPCPFCGSDRLSVEKVGDGFEYAVACSCCGAIGPPHVKTTWQAWEAAELAAGVRWNERDLGHWATLAELDPPAEPEDSLEFKPPEGCVLLSEVEAQGLVLEGSEPDPEPEPEDPPEDPVEDPETNDEAEARNRLGVYMMENDLSLTKVAHDTGVSYPTLKNLIDGAGVSDKTLEKLNEALDELESDDFPAPKPITL